MRDNFKLVKPEFHSFVQGASTDELKQKIVELTKEEFQVLKTRDEDDELNDSKQKVKELKEPYSQALKELRQKIGLVSLTLDERGQ